MEQKQMATLMETIFKEIQKMRAAGQKEYARKSDDVHANFKRVGEYTKTDPAKVIMVYLLKHIDGINAHIDGHTSQREAVEGRIIDAIVYLFLLWGYLNEPKNMCIETPYPDVESSSTPIPEFKEE